MYFVKLVCRLWALENRTAKCEGLLLKAISFASATISGHIHEN